MSNEFDPTRLTLLLSELRLPAVKHIWPSFAERSDKEGWPAARFTLLVPPAAARRESWATRLAARARAWLAPAGPRTATALA